MFIIGKRTSAFLHAILDFGRAVLYGLGDTQSWTRRSTGDYDVDRFVRR
jgi:hypothetical protein